MRHYAKTWRNRHPYPDDFFAAFQEGAGVDCQWFMEDAFRSVKQADWGVTVSQSRAAKPAGWFQEGTGPFKELAEDEGGEEPDVVHAGDTETQEDEDSDEDEADKEKRPWEVSVLLTQKEEFCIPVTWEITYADGSTERGEWTRAQQLEQNWHRMSFESDKKVDSVVLDPDSDCWIDVDMSDNQWHAKKDKVTALRWSERVLSQWEHMLLWYMSVGG
jgi:hypothetical protein